MSNRKKSSDLKKALRTIERIAVINNENEENKVLSDIYIIAHSHIGDCKNPHIDWVARANKIAEELKDI